MVIFVTARLLDNLLSSTTYSVSIAVTLSRDSESWVLKVADDDRIHPDQINVFTPFVQVSKAAAQV